MTADELGHGRWSLLPAAPIPKRDYPLGVWTGKRLLVWSDWEQLHRSTVTTRGGQHAIREEGRDGVDV